MKYRTSWYSDRVHQDVTVVRWGEIGTPVLLFPTAGGDAEEMERFQVIDSLAPLLGAGRIKIYSVDSVAGAAMLRGEIAPEHQMALKNRYHEFVYREVVPFIRNDCGSPDIGIIATGSSIGAFNALAMICRYPEAFTHAVCLSGTYDLERFFKQQINPEFYLASPLHFLPGLEGDTLERLRTRFVLLAAGQGRAEAIGETWRTAHILGQKGIPNRVDPWGEEWHHDWVTWRKMWPLYLDELTRG